MREQEHARFRCVSETDTTLSASFHLVRTRPRLNPSGGYWQPWHDGLFCELAVIPINPSTALGGESKVGGNRGLRLAARLLETTLPQAFTTATADTESL